MRLSLLRKHLVQALKYSDERINRLKEENKYKPKSFLIIGNRGSRCNYYEEKDKKRVGITSKPERVRKIARARFVDMYISELEKEHQWCNKVLADYDKKFGSHIGDKIGKYLKRFENTDIELIELLCSAEQLQWRNEPSMNNFKNEQKNRFNMRGVGMRSFGETTISNICDEYCLPIRYEMGFEIDVTHMKDVSYTHVRNGRYYRWYYPDFVILLPNGDIIIWEHLGLIDKESYRSDLGERITAYLSTGLVDIDHLILTYPDDVNDPSRIRRIIEEKILPLM